MRYGQKKIPPAFYLLVFAYLSYCLLFTPNFFVSIPIALFPMIIFRLLWVDGTPNIVFWGMMMQWLPITVHLFYCNIVQITLMEYFSNTVLPTEFINLAVLLSAIGLLFFSLGIFYALRKYKPKEPIAQSADAYSTIKIIRLYAIVSFIVLSSSALIWSLGSFTQYVFYFFYIKWGFFLIAFYFAHKMGKESAKFLYLIIAVEFILGLVSYFASAFLFVVFFSALGLIALRPKLTVKSYFFLLLAGACVFHLSVLWTSIKGDYRGFISQGVVGAQAATTGVGESLSKMQDLLSTVDNAKYNEAIYTTIDRAGCIQLFSATLSYVPAVIPHENGKIYMEAVQHYLVPRFLNPNKAVLDDSKHTNQYTGLSFTTAEGGASFSLGYIADAYIDFGPVYMFPLLFVFGYLFGITYKYLYDKSPNEVWSWILTGPYFLLLNINGADTKKALGPLLIYFLTVAILRKQMIKRVDPLMRK